MQFPEMVLVDTQHLEKALKDMKKF